MEKYSGYGYTHGGSAWGSETPKRVVTLGEGLEVWAGPWSRRPDDLDYFLSLVGEPPRARVHFFGFTLPISLGKEPKGVAIDWPDMAAPDFLGRDFWQELAGFFARQKGTLYIGCAAGKGRTGTALAILAYFWGLTKEPIKWVRETYSAEAVETPSQVEYVAKITGVKENLPASRDASP